MWLCDGTMGAGSIQSWTAGASGVPLGPPPSLPQETASMRARSAHVRTSFTAAAAMAVSRNDMSRRPSSLRMQASTVDNHVRPVSAIWTRGASLKKFMDSKNHFHN